MNKTYRLFRAYCLTAITVLCLLLLAVGICTAKIQTDETVFKSAYSSVGVFACESGVTVNLGGKILSFMPETALSVLEKVRMIFLAPINNLIEIILRLVR